MPYKLTDWPLLLRDNPKEAASRLLEALAKNDGRVVHAAKALGMSVRRVWSFVDALGLQPEVDRLREESRARKKRLRALKFPRK